MPAFQTIANFASGNTSIVTKLNQASDNLRSLRRFNSYGLILSLVDDMNVPTATLEEISWDVVEYQSDAAMWGVALPKRLIAPIAGIYGVCMNVEWRESTGGERTMGVTKSTGAVRIDLTSQGSNDGGGNLSGLDYIQMAANAYLIANVYQSTGSTIGIRGNGMDRTNIAFWLAGV